MAIFSDMTRVKWQKKKNEIQFAFDRKCQYMASWWRENKEWAIVVIPATVAVGTKVITVCAKTINAHQQAKVAQINACTMWDPVKQIHVQTKHPLTRIELEDYMRLTQSGMTVSDALLTLNLI